MNYKLLGMGVVIAIIVLVAFAVSTPTTPSTTPISLTGYQQWNEMTGVSCNVPDDCKTIFVDAPTEWLSQQQFQCSENTCFILTPIGGEQGVVS